MASNVGADFLIQEAKAVTRGSDPYKVVIKALGEAGGHEAVDYLVAEAQATTRGSDPYNVVMAALGRASRSQ